MSAAGSLDGRTFAMVSSTASRVDPAAPTRFLYHEVDGMVWGEYTGDTVSAGRFVGTRTGEQLQVAFVHVPVQGGAPVSGEAVSRVEQDADGALRLVEDFEADGEPQVSVCPDGSATLGAAEDRRSSSCP